MDAGTPPAASLAELAWLEGTWVGEGLGGTVLESYSAPAGGHMIGHFRLVRDGQPVFYELIIVAQAGDSIEYRVKHFDPDLKGWEPREDYDGFRLIRVEPDLWIFDKAMIRRTGPDTNEQAVRPHAGADWTDHFRYRRTLSARP